MPYADVNGARLSFEDSGGEGPVVVFSHGKLMDRDMWAHQIRVLAGGFRDISRLDSPVLRNSSP